jgi:hypothetical protein
MGDWVLADEAMARPQFIVGEVSKIRGGELLGCVVVYCTS